METKTFKVQGLHCTDCAGVIQCAVTNLEGVNSCKVDVETGRLTLWLDTADFDTTPVAKIVAETGHKLLPEQTSAEKAPTLSFFRFMLSERETLQTTIAGGLTLLGLILHWTGLLVPLQIALFVVAILVGGLPVARHAWQEIRARSLGINALMVIAVIGAGVIGEWSEAAIVVTLFSLGEALEGYATERARGALEQLLDLLPPVALKLQPDGSTVETPIAELALHDRVVVRPGDRVSVDGIVRSGQSAVDQAAITGESIPVDKAPGTSVYAGTINTFGALEIEVTSLAADNTLNRMIQLVQESQARQAPVQQFVERFARIYTPIVTISAALIAIAPPLVTGQPFWGEAGWLMRALQLLVISCPCALVISTPVSVVSALTHAAARGVLIKGGKTLEALGSIKVFAFDKTGTLTEGRPITTHVLNCCNDGTVNDHGLQYAAAIENHSSHPLAQALVAEARARELVMLPAQNINQMSGQGITGTVADRRITVANHLYFDQQIPHTEAICRLADGLAQEGKTVMMLSHDEQICSIFAVADTLRPESHATLEALHKTGKMHTVMLTGDNARIAATIGQQAGVDEVRAELLPAQKVAEIERLTTAQGPVAMVGDGVNDAPALARAAVGIAMGGAASAQAMETADVVLMGNDLRQLPFLVDLSRRTRQIIRMNIALALLIKALVFSLAVVGLGTLWLAIVADVGASLLVILNGLRLRA